jgi:hypothetical protein
MTLLEIALAPAEPAISYHAGPSNADPASENGTTDTHRDRGLGSGPVGNSKYKATSAELAMGNSTQYLGLDVHAETISAAITEGRGEILRLGKSKTAPSPSMTQGSDMLRILGKAQGKLPASGK